MGEYPTTPDLQRPSDKMPEVKKRARKWSTKEREDYEAWHKREYGVCPRYKR